MGASQTLFLCLRHNTLSGCVASQPLRCASREGQSAHIYRPGNSLLKLHCHYIYRSLLQITAVYDIGISPDNFEDWPHTLKEMLSWAFEPASDELLLEFIGGSLGSRRHQGCPSQYAVTITARTENKVLPAGKGRADAKAWAAATAVVDVLEPGASKEASAQSEQQGENYEELKRARPPVHEEDSAAAGLVQGKAATTPAN